MPINLFLDAPKNFSFWQTVCSHGWSQLLPFEIDKENWRLSYIFANPYLKNPTTAQISETEGKLKIEIADGKINSKTEEIILRDVRHILRLDDDLRNFNFEFSFRFANLRRRTEFFKYGLAKI